MDIDKLQKALAIMNKDGKSGSVFSYHDEVLLYPMTDSFTEDEVDALEKLGFMPSEEDDGFFCFT